MTLSIRPTHSPLSLEAVLKETNLGFYPRAILNIREPVEEKILQSSFSLRFP